MDVKPEFVGTPIFKGLLRREGNLCVLSSLDLNASTLSPSLSHGVWKPLMNSPWFGLNTRDITLNLVKQKLFDNTKYTAVGIYFYAVNYVINLP